MYDIDEQPTAESNEWDIPRLDFEFKGNKGVVVFRSLEELSGRDIDRLRSQMGAAKNDGEMTNTLYLEAARTLIESWDIPGQSHLPIPKGDPKGWGSISAVTRRQIETHMKPYLNRLLKETDGDPTAPASA